MAGTSTIEWTEATWNPVTGCTKVSPGCDHCYAETFAERWRGIPGHAYEQGFDLKLWPERLNLPLSWRKPRVIFVNSMSDLFQVGVPDAFVLQVFKVMQDTPQHTYQILTKRADRMERFMRRLAWSTPSTEERKQGVQGMVPYLMDPLENERMGYPTPRANIWLGVSVENQTYASRIRHLRRTPVAVRFVSAEPLLGPLDLSEFLNPPLTTLEFFRVGGRVTRESRIHWVIAGGESGPGARPMDLDWVRELSEQCRTSGTALFVKQLGTGWARKSAASASKGGDMDEWPADLRVREMPREPVKEAV